MPPRRLIPALCALPLVLGAAGCSDLLGPISPQGATPYFTDLPWTETADSVLIDFEAVPHFVGVGFSYFRGAGVRLPDWARVVDPDIPWFGQYWYTHTPPTSGKHIIGLGYFLPNRTEGDISFYQPVTSVSFSVRPTGDFFITCYNGTGGQVGAAVAPGWRNPFFPVAAQRLSISAEGITRCRLSVQGGSLDDFSFKRTKEDELVLTCPNAVMRGDRIDCSVAAKPNGEIKVEQWWFVGTDSRGQEYRYDQEDVPTGSWSGEMALSGTVHVRARVDGAAPVEKSAAVTVTNRQWDDESIEYHVQRVGLDAFPERDRPPLPPGNVRDLGRTYMEATPLSRSDPGVLKFILDDGPNSLLAYLGRIPLEAAAFVLVSPAMAEGSDFYRAQRVDPPAFSQRPPCLQRDFDRFVSLILHHEGYPAHPESHTGVFISELTSRARGVEDVVGPNDALHELQTIWQTRLRDAASQALVQAADPVDDRFPIPFGCEFNFRVAR